MSYGRRERIECKEEMRGSMKVTVLGCGTSGGVPQLGGGWGVCDSGNKKNRRRRASLLLESGGKRVLIDTSPDLREQLLGLGVDSIDSVLYTHSHADHTHGIDDLRWISKGQGSSIPAYTNRETLSILRTKFSYIFGEGISEGGEMIYSEVLRGIEVGYGEKFEVSGLHCEVLRQDHGFSESLGFRVGNFAYSTDVVKLSEENFEQLRGIEYWVVDCLSWEAHPTHAHVGRVISWVERIGVSNVWLTHMNKSLDYEDLCKNLPSGILPSYDGMEIET